MDQEFKAFFQSEQEPFRVATPFFELLNVGVLEGTAQSFYQHMTSSRFRPMSYAIIDQPIDGLLSESTLLSPAPSVVQHAPNKVTVKAKLTQPGLLVLGDMYYSG